MLFYTSLFLFVFLLTFIEEKSLKKGRNMWVFAMFVLLASVSGFRYLGGTDLELYETIYNKIPTIISKDFLDVFYNVDYFFWEPGYLIYISSIKTFTGLSFYGYLLLNAIVFYFCLYKGHSKYTRHWGLVLMFFMYKLFFYETFVAMRQCISIALFWLILHYAEERKPLRYIVLWLLIVLPMHNAGIILVFVYLFNYIKITKERFLILGAIFAPFTFFSSVLNDLVGGVMALLSESKSEYAFGNEQQNILYTIEYYLVWTLVYLNFDKIRNVNVHASFIIKMFLIILPCVTIFRDIIILRRVMDYFYLTVPILLGYICDSNRNSKFAIISILTLICFYGYTRYINNFDGGKGLVPYLSWLELPNATLFMK